MHTIAGKSASISDESCSALSAVMALSERQAKRARHLALSEQLPPTFHATKFQGCGIKFKGLAKAGRPGEVVLLRTISGQTAEYARIQIDGSNDDPNWIVLPEGLCHENWIGCDGESGNLFFLRGHTLCQVSQDAEQVLAELDHLLQSAVDDIVDDICLVQPLSAPKRGFLCYNHRKREVHILKSDGSEWAGPYRVPERLAKCVSMATDFCDHGVRFVCADGSPMSMSPPRSFFVGSGHAVYRWDAPDHMHCLAGQEEPIKQPFEGYGTSAGVVGIIGGVSSDHIFMSHASRLQRLDVRNNEVRVVNFVDSRGIELIPSSHKRCLDLIMNPLTQQLLVLPFSMKLEGAREDDTEDEEIEDSVTREYKLSHGIVVDLSSDPCASTMLSDFAGVDWSEKGRLVVFKVGESKEHIEVDSRVLEARSNHFARALSSGMRESWEGVVYLHDTSKAAMQCFVHYLHTDMFDPKLPDEQSNIKVKISQLLPDGKIGIKYNESALLTSIRQEVTTLGCQLADRIVAVSGHAVKDRRSARKAIEAAKVKIVSSPLILTLQRTNTADLLKTGHLCLAVYRLAEKYGVLRLQKLALCGLRQCFHSGTALQLLEEAARGRSYIDDELARACWRACHQFWDAIVRDYQDVLEELVKRCPSLATWLLCGSTLTAEPPGLGV